MSSRTKLDITGFGDQNLPGVSMKYHQCDPVRPDDIYHKDV